MLFARHLSSPSRKRAREEDEGELEYEDESGQQGGTPEPQTKRPRVEVRETSTAPSRPSNSLPIPPIPRFGPKERCDIYPMYKPAVPGYKPS